MNIRAWLAEIGLDQYGDAFETNDIDREVLPDLSDPDLREIGVLSLGHRKKLLRAIGQMASGVPSGVPSGVSGGVAGAAERAPLDVTPGYLADRILRNRAALVGERKQVTVFFADLKSSTEMIQSLDPEEARAILDPAITAMVDAVHRYEGIVNKILGDGIMALFGAPIAHEDHAVRACYAALALQESMAAQAEATRQRYGVEPLARVGLHSGEVVVRAIGNDLSMDYDAIGPTTHLAARMEQIAPAGHIRLTAATLRLAEGAVVAEPQGLVPVKGIDQPVEVYDLIAASGIRSRLRRITGNLTRFVGRATEMAALEHALAEAKAGRGCVVGSIGEAGLGKSRLYHEFCHGPQTDGCFLLESGSVSYGKANTYAPVAEFLRAYFRLGPRDTTRDVREKVTGKLLALDPAFSALVPPVLALFDIVDETSGWPEKQPAQRRRETIDAVRSILTREGQEQPVVAVFEDLHWLDPESLAVLDGLIESLGNARILLLVNFRPEFDDPWTARSHYARLRLDPLKSENANELLDHLLGDDESLRGLKALLVDKTGGNPFFIEESVLDLVERGSLDGVPGGYRLTVPSTTVTVPPTVQAVLASRIDRLEAAEKQLLQTAAVIGKDFSLQLLEEVAELDAEALMDGLAALQTAELVQETRLFPEKEYSFKHALSHETAYGGILNEQRATLHRRIADAIASLYAGRLPEFAERLAHHALKGGDWEKAHKYGRVAGERAASMSAARAAIDNLSLALEALLHLPQTDATIGENIDLRFLIRDALFVLGDPEPVAEHIAEAERLAEMTGDSARLMTNALFVAAHNWQLGQHTEAAEAGRQALGYATEIGDPEATALAHYRIGSVEMTRGRFGDAHESLAAAGAWFDPPEYRNSQYYGGLVKAFIGSFDGWALAQLGRFAEADAIAGDAVALAKSADQSYSRAVAVFGQSEIHLLRGDWAAAAAALDVGLQLSRLHDFSVTQMWTCARLACAHAAMGRREDARAMIDLTETPLVANGSPQDANPLVWLVRAEILLGDLDSASARAERAIARARAQDEVANEAWLTWCLGEIAASADPAAAGAHFDRAATLAREHALAPFAAMIDLSRATRLGDGDAAGRAREAFDRMGLPNWTKALPG